MERAIDALSAEVARWWNEQAVLCLTGGLDSRLLLAVLLAQGIRPGLFVVGQPGSFDAEVAEAIARRFGLPLRREEVLAEDFLEHAARIAAATSGMLPLSHWPGVLLATKAPQATLFLGLNGEYARSYYFDRGMLSLALDSLAAGRVGPWLLQARLRFPGPRADLERLHPALAAEFAPSGIARRLQRLLGPVSELGPALDEAYLNHYGANKTGSDLSALGAYRRHVVPFFAPAWIDALRGLSRGWKLDGRFHRYAIGKLSPELLRFPEVRAGRRVASTAGGPKPLYWLARQRLEVKHFFNQAIYDDSRLLDLVTPVLALIEDIVDPSILARARTDAGVRHLVFSLATVAIWYSQVLTPGE